MDAPVCPQCGLEEKQALRKSADLYWADGRKDLAVDYYGRYLALDPADFDVACKRASYLCSLARNRRDPLLFEKADGQITRILEDHWDWQAGHQARVDLYFCFGKLDSLLGEYQKIGEADPSRAAGCGQVIQLIRLVMRFKEEKPPVPESLKDGEEMALLLRSFWPLLAGIGIAWALTLLVPQASDEEIARRGAFLRQSVMGVAILGLGFFGMWRYQKGLKAGNPKKPKAPRPPLVP